MLITGPRAEVLTNEVTGRLMSRDDWAYRVFFRPFRVVRLDRQRTRKVEAAVMTNGEMGTHAAGRWELIYALGRRGIIQIDGIWRDGPGRTDAEIAEVARRIERALRREYRGGQRQTRRDVWRVLRGKKPRDLRTAAPVLYELLKTMKRSLVMVSGLKKLTMRGLKSVFYGP